MERVKMTGKTQVDVAAERAEEDRLRVNDEAQAYLRDTDRYFIRQAETGKAMPDGMREKRREARAAVRTEDGV